MLATTEIERPGEHVYVSLDVVWHGAAGKFDARLGEISMDGCFIDSMGQEILGETIGFTVHLPSGIWVSLEGVVVYQEYPIGFEVRFKDLSKENQTLVAQVVAAHGGKGGQQFLFDELTQSSQQIVEPRRILVADDDPMTVEMVTTILESQGHKVVSASDGREAFSVLQTDTKFDAAIYDMMMPHLDGLGLIRYTTNDGRLKHIPVGMITAQTDPKIWNDSLTAGAKVFLPKPFTPPQILMMLNMLVLKSESGSLTQNRG